MQSGASAFTALTGGSLQVPQIVIGVLAVLSAIVGYRLIVRAESVIAYLMLANLVLLSIAAVAVLPLGDLLGNPASSTTGFLAQFGASAVYQLAIAPIVSDYTRYLPSKISGITVSAAVFFGTVLSALWIESLGAGVALSYPDLDVVSGIRKLGDTFGFGLGSITMVISIVVCLVTAAVSLYSGTVSMLSGIEAFRPLRPTARLRTVALVVVGVVVLATGLLLPADILNTFSVFLTLLGYMLIPWTAVNLTDYYLIRKGNYSISDILMPDGGIYGRWNWRGLLSYTVGFLLMIPFFSTSLFTGPIAARLDGADISFVIGLTASTLTYQLLMRRFDRQTELAYVGGTALNTLLRLTTQEA